jgi:PTH1 family peptidyl-tRNA hydrolase
MKLIIGLGNPGRAYLDSRHNIGFLIIKSLAKIYKIPLKRESGTFSLIGRGTIDGQRVTLAMPLTFMNLSGSCVELLLKKYKTLPANLLVICDDLDLELGRLKIRPSGSSGGHRGLQSIMASLGTQDFCRLRVGISRPHKNTAAASYVLSAFTNKEKKQVKEIIARAADCCSVWVTRGIAQSMNIFNKRSN